MSRFHGSSPVPSSPGTAFRLACEVLSVPVTFRTPSLQAARAVEFQYASMGLACEKEPGDEDTIQAGSGGETGGITVDILPAGADPESFEVSFDSESAFRADGCGHLLHELDNQLTFRLQQRLPGLYFVHAACLARTNGATLFMGESGAGKSTTAFALCARGLSYLSDELAPIDASSGKVFPYPRSLCLKNPPPPPLVLPPETLRTEWTLHVLANHLGASVGRAPVLLKRIIFLKFLSGQNQARLRSLSRGEAAVRLYQNALNQLAHPMWGLEDTLRIVAGAECYELNRGGVEETLRLVERTGAV